MDDLKVEVNRRARERYGCRVSLPPATARKWAKVAKARRWTYPVLADYLVDCELDRMIAELRGPEAPTKEVPDGNRE